MKIKIKKEENHNKTKMVNSRLSEAEHKQLTEKAKKDGVSVSYVFQQFLQLYLEGKIEIK